MDFVKLTSKKTNVIDQHTKQLLIKQFEKSMIDSNTNNNADNLKKSKKF